MPNKIANLSYDQIPHIVLHHPDTTPDHWAIMICLYKILKDKPTCTYSSKQLAIDSRNTLRTVERKIPQLIKMGFIESLGKGYSRRFTLGLLLNNPATVAVQKLTNPATVADTPAKIDINNRHGGGHTKNSTKNSLNAKTLLDSLTQTQRQELHYWNLHPEHAPEEYKQLLKII